ncbi:MAG: flagellar hook-basal body complex protein [Actinomycetota bacterium]
MSLYGALFAGVSGLASQSSAMGAISDNITNVNTVGYKGSKVNFSTLVTKQVSLTQYSPGGVQSKPRAGIDTQGLLQATSEATDVALSGQGMFVVNTDSNPAASGTGMFAYTRAGSFKVDKQGYLQNVSGFFLQGWPLTSTDNSVSAKPSETTIDGNTYMKAYKDPSTGTFHYCNQNIIDPYEVKPLNLKTIGGTADATTQVKIGANLPSGDSVYDPTVTGSSGLHQTSTLVYDSLGNTHSFDLNWMKTNANTWNIQQQTDLYSLNTTLTATTAAPDTAADFAINGTTVISNGGTTGCTFSAAGTITFATAADAAALPVGSVFTVSGAEDTGNNGTFMVTANAGGVVTIQSNKYLTQRGIAPPSGSASMTIYDTTGNNNYVYASQGRMDFTQASRADVTALNGKSFTVTNPASAGGTGLTTTFKFDTTGALTDGTPAGTVYINISNATITTGAQVAALVKSKLGDPRSYLAAANGGVAGQNTIAAGGTIPLVTSTGATVNIVQQVGAQQLDFDLSGLPSASCLQTQTHTWSAASPSVDSPTGTFSVAKITQAGNAVDFNGDGTPQNIRLTKLEVAWCNGAQSMTLVPNGTGAEHRMSLFLGNTNQADGLTQLGGTYQLSYMQQNGAKFGNFSGVSITSDGVVTALFDNGVRRPVFQIPVATFTNANGMESLTGNTWIETATSGSYTLRTAGQAGSGTVNSASLESSTVDIGSEFTTMIVTQRAYSAAAKIITTTDQMLDELVNIKR